MIAEDNDKCGVLALEQQALEPHDRDRLGGRRDRGAMTYRRFRWKSSAALDADHDLRSHGWTLVSGGEPSAITLFDVRGLDNESMMRLLVPVDKAERGDTIVLGVANSRLRGLLLSMGFADALKDHGTLDELSARAERAVRHSDSLPRFREFRGLCLDLLAREAYRDQRPLDLNPREFALLWRLSDSPNQTVSKKDLIQDVWNMGFVPETNSIAVHMSRLRRKLLFVGLSQIIETSSAGGYRLVTGDHDTAADEFAFGELSPSHGADNGERA